jgi:UDP-N-acetylglucosamine--N-acetylmuramyl-(pentapeptide) pyrophosphoryl-undecaprenol N-acetylglucosamine transferase
MKLQFLQGKTETKRFKERKNSLIAPICVILTLLLHFYHCCGTIVSMRICYSGGGTLGHILPALSVHQRLQAEKGLSELWIGRDDFRERQEVEAMGIAYAVVPSGKLRRYFSLRNLTDLGRLAMAFSRSLSILRGFKPDVLFSKGGFVSVPPVMAAWLLHIPVLTHESDSSIGLANRINCHFATVLATGFDLHLEKLGHARVVYTGNPVRKDLADAIPAETLGFYNDDKPLLLVLGGSQGANELNALVTGSLDRLCPVCNVFHQCGKGKTSGIVKEGYREEEFIGTQLPGLYRRADLVVCRSGAGTLSELAALGKPALLLPLRSASRGEQEANATFYEKKGAAEVLEKGCSADMFADMVVSLLGDETKRSTMSQAMKKISSADAGEKIVCLLKELAAKKEK